MAYRPGRHRAVHGVAPVGSHAVHPPPVGLQQEASRYTLYTVEPVMSGIMRTKPGAAFWGWFWSILGFIQLGWPGWAAAAATAVVAALIGGVPGPEQEGAVKSRDTSPSLPHLSCCSWARR